MSTRASVSSPAMRDGGTFGAGVTLDVIAWVLVIVGFATVCLSGSLGHTLVQKVQFGPGSYGWNPEQAKEIAQNLRWIGSMIFALGLVERLVLEIRSVRRKIEKP